MRIGNISELNSMILRLCVFHCPVISFVCFPLSSHLIHQMGHKDLFGLGVLRKISSIFCSLILKYERYLLQCDSQVMLWWDLLNMQIGMLFSCLSIRHDLCLFFSLTRWEMWKAGNGSAKPDLNSLMVQWHLSGVWNQILHFYECQDHIMLVWLMKLLVNIWIVKAEKEVRFQIWLNVEGLNNRKSEEVLETGSFMLPQTTWRLEFYICGFCMLENIIMLNRAINVCFVSTDN